MNSKNVNNMINIELEKIFSIFNKEYFNKELTTPLFIVGEKIAKNGSFNNDTVVNCKLTYAPKIEIPIEVLNSSIYDVAACVLHNMIHYYEYASGNKYSSNNNVYHNKKFKKLAESFGLEEIGYDSINGFIMGPGYVFKNDCDTFGFKKTWNNVYKNIDGPNRKQSTRRYICKKCGMIIRATKNVNIICGDCGIKLAKAE